MTASACLLVCSFSQRALTIQGHEKHEWTSGIAIKSVFKFLWEREAAFAAGEDPEDKHYPGETSSSEEAEMQMENEKGEEDEKLETQ